MTRKEILNLSDSAVNESVKIAGTDYDRRRKVTKEIAYRMKRMVESGNKTFAEIGEHYGVSPNTVRYNTDPEFRKSEIERRYNYAFTPSTKDLHEVANYKRSLIKQGKKLVVTA